MSSTTTSQTYARIENAEVHMKTFIWSTLRNSDGAGEMMHTAEITSKLKAAEPTIVEAPSSEGSSSSDPSVSITARRISGAEEPSASSVRFATVGFQNDTTRSTVSPVTSSFSLSVFCLEVMTSIEVMKTSATTATPIKRYSSSPPSRPARTAGGDRYIGALTMPVKCSWQLR